MMKRKCVGVSDKDGKWFLFQVWRCMLSKTWGMNN